MFDRLFDVIVRVWEWLIPFTVVYDYQRAVQFRLGRLKRVLEPGFHWVWPFGIDNVVHENISWNTTALHDQSLTTSDNVQCSISAVLTWRIHKIQDYLIAVQDQDHALPDTAYGAITRYVLTHTWGEIASEAALKDLTAEVRKRGWRFGIEVEQVQLVNVTRSRSIRLLGMSS